MAKAREAGRPDLQGRIDDFYAEIAPRLDAIDAEFAEDAGQGFRPRIQDGGPGPEGAGAQVDEGPLAARDPAQSLDPGPVGGEPDQLTLDLFGDRRPGNAAHRALVTDPEGRTIAARFVAGIRNPGGPDTALSTEETIQVQFGLAVCGHRPAIG